jgi:hypothetical protein
MDTWQRAQVNTGVIALGRNCVVFVDAMGSGVDAFWGRRSRSLPRRLDLIPLRETLAEAKARPDRGGWLTASPNFKGHVHEHIRSAHDGWPDCR